MASLRSRDGRFSLHLSPDAGCCLLGLRLHDVDLLSGYPDGKALDMNRWARGNFLFPFPNRLRDGQLPWQGEILQFPINDPITGNALHGLLMKASYLLEERQDFGSRALLRYVLQSDRDLEAYPFAFRIQQEFQLDVNDGFQLTTTATNLDTDPIPVAWGWHPYFQLGGSCDAWQLKLPACQWVGVNERMLPTGKLYDYDHFETLRSIGPEVLDNCLQLIHPADPAEVVLKGPAGTLSFGQQTGPGKYNFLQVFTHPDRKSLSLEPMTCAVDGLRTGLGQIVLQPGQAAQARFSLGFTPAP